MEFLNQIPDAVWSQIGFAITSICAGIAVCVGCFWGANLLLDKALPSHGRDAALALQIDRRRTAIRPWIFLFPALLFLSLFLIYPFVMTVINSFFDKNGDAFVGFENYQFIFTQEAFWEAVRNNFLWIIVVPAACTFLGLVIAVMADRIWWGTFAKTLIFLPMAISFVGAAVIWKFVYEFQSGDTQIGLLNAVIQLFGADPRSYIDMPFWNNIFLMIILIWIQTGFAMVILSVTLVPLYHRLKVYTIYEALEDRFGLRLRLTTSFLFLLSRGASLGFSISAPAYVLSLLFYFITLIIVLPNISYAQPLIATLSMLNRN